MVHVIEVPVTTVRLVHAEPPMAAVAPDKNPVPVIVTAVPPPSAPPVGEILATVGAAW